MCAQISLQYFESKSNRIQIGCFWTRTWTPFIYLPSEAWEPWEYSRFTWKMSQLDTNSNVHTVDEIVCMITARRKMPLHIKNIDIYLGMFESDGISAVPCNFHSRPHPTYLENISASSGASVMYGFREREKYIQCQCAHIATSIWVIKCMFENFLVIRCTGNMWCMHYLAGMSVL